MRLSEKLSLLRKQNDMTQEQFAEELSVSRQTVSKWERGDSLPDIKTLELIADFYEMSLDHLARDEYGISPLEGWESTEEKTGDRSQNYQGYIGKICDISMKNFRYAVIRNAEIIGLSDRMLCFLKNKRLGYVNVDKTIGILPKKEGCSPLRKNRLTLGKCTLFADKGSYFGGMTYNSCEIIQLLPQQITICTGQFEARVPVEDVAVILMKEKTEV